MYLFAQGKQVEDAFHRAADTWGLATTILLTALIVVSAIVLAAIYKLWRWLQPKMDSGFAIHFGLVSALTDAVKEDVPKIKDAMAGLLKEMEKQTAGIGVQTDNIKTQTTVLNELAEKLNEWPSDIEKVCKAEQVLKDAGFSPKVIERCLRIRGIRKPKEGDQK